jgi:hypothetical protein
MKELSYSGYFLNDVLQQLEIAMVLLALYLLIKSATLAAGRIPKLTQLIPFLERKTRDFEWSAFIELFLSECLPISAAGWIHLQDATRRSSYHSINSVLACASLTGCCAVLAWFHASVQSSSTGTAALDDSFHPLIEGYSKESEYAYSHVILQALGRLITSAALICFFNYAWLQIVSTSLISVTLISIATATRPWASTQLRILFYASEFGHLAFSISTLGLLPPPTDDNRTLRSLMAAVQLAIIVLTWSVNMISLLVLNFKALAAQLKTWHQTYSHRAIRPNLAH